jgi:hypothetical protein
MPRSREGVGIGTPQRWTTFFQQVNNGVDGELLRFREVQYQSVNWSVASTSHATISIISRGLSLGTTTERCPSSAAPRPVWPCAGPHHDDPHRRDGAGGGAYNAYSAHGSLRQRTGPGATTKWRARTPAWPLACRITSGPSPSCCTLTSPCPAYVAPAPPTHRGPPCAIFRQHSSLPRAPSRPTTALAA